MISPDGVGVNERWSMEDWTCGQVYQCVSCQDSRVSRISEGAYSKWMILRRLGMALRREEWSISGDMSSTSPGWHSQIWAGSDEISAMAEWESLPWI